MIFIYCSGRQIHNNDISITTVVVIKTPCRTLVGFRGKHISHVDNCPIQPMPILSATLSCDTKYPRCLSRSPSQMVWHGILFLTAIQSQSKTHPVVIPHPSSTLVSSHNQMGSIHSCSHCPLEECLQEQSMSLSNLAKLIALYSGERCCVVSFAAFLHSATTSQSYQEPNI